MRIKKEGRGGGAFSCPLSLSFSPSSDRVLAFFLLSFFAGEERDINYIPSLPPPPLRQDPFDFSPSGKKKEEIRFVFFFPSPMPLFFFFFFSSAGPPG